MNKKWMLFRQFTVLVVSLVPIVLGNNLAQAQTFRWPVNDNQIPNIGIGEDYSAYDQIHDPRFPTYAKKYHTGIDITTPATDRAVVASATGYVRDIKYDTGNGKGWGNAILLEHDGGIYTLYAHLDNYFDKDKKITFYKKYKNFDRTQQIPIGTPLGIMGETGAAIGVHLHFEIKKPFDPNNSWGPGYTVDLPDGYKYNDPRVYILPPISETPINPIVVKVISTTNLNVRSGPGTAYAWLWTQVRPNQKFVAYKQNSDWYKIYLPNANGATSDGTTVSGWCIKTDALTEDKTVGQILVTNTGSVDLYTNNVGNLLPVRTVNGFANLKIWGGQRFAVLDRTKVGRIYWDRIDLPTLASQSSGWVNENDGVKYFSPQSGQTLSVSLTANPQTGNVPLKGVDFTATVSGNATGTINYTFYANRSDSGTNITPGYCFKIDGRNPNGTGGTVVYRGTATSWSGGTTFTVRNVYNYTSAGTYTAKVIAERGSAPPAESRMTITVNPVVPDFVFLPPAPATQTIAQGNSTRYTVSLRPLNGYNSPVSLSITGISPSPGSDNPITCSFSPSTVTPPATARLNISTLRIIMPQTYTIYIRGQDGTKIHDTSVQLVVNPSALNGSISGKVYEEESGNPLNGVAIQATQVTQSGNWQPRGSTTTQGSGNYRIQGLIPGQYYVSAQRSGFGTVIKTDIPVLSGRETSNQNLSMTNHPGWIYGTVKDNTDSLFKVDSNTIALWRFNESSGNAVIDSMGINNGTAIGTSIVDGKFGNARYFNGLSDYITVPDNPSLDNLSQATIEAWVKPTGFDLSIWCQTEGLVVKGGDTDFNYSNAFGIWMTRNALYSNGYASDFTQISFGMNFGKAGASSLWHAPNQWYYVVGTFDGSNAKIYVNGVLEGTGIGPSSIVANSRPLYINHHTWNLGEIDSSQRMQGLIDEIRISNIARSAEEIAYYYNLATNESAVENLGIRVSLKGAQGRTYYINGTNTASGTGYYEIRDLGQGNNYQLRTNGTTINNIDYASTVTSGVLVQKGQGTNINLVLQPAAKIFGTVKDAQGNPVKGITINCWVDNNSDIGGGDTTTDGSGNYKDYSLRYLLPGHTYTVDVIPPSDTNYIIQRFQMNVPSAGNYEHNITLESGAIKISGNVKVKATQQPPQDTAVEIGYWNSQYSVWRSVYVNQQDGSYVLTNLPKEGEIEITVRPESVYAWDGTVTSFQQDAVVNFELVPEATISGVIKDFDTGLPVTTSLNIGYSIDNGERSVNKGFSTNPADGTFSLTGLPSGLAEVTVEPQIETGYAWKRTYFYLSEGEQRTSIELLIKKGALVSGNLKDTVGTGIPNKEILINGSGGEETKVYTDYSGNFQVRLSNGTYGAALVDTDMRDWTVIPLEFTITGPADDKTIELIGYNPTSASYINGEVINTGGYPKTSNFIVIATKAGRAWTKETIRYLEAISMAMLDNAGSYQLMVPPGYNYDLCLVVFDGKVVSSVTKRDAIASVSGGSTGQNLYYNSVGGTISGTVTYNGKPVIMATVFLTDLLGNFVGFAYTIDAAGTYHLYNVPVGNYIISAWHPDYGDSSNFPVNGVTDNGTVTADIVIQ